MKISFVLLAAAAVISGSTKAPRKISLFTRTKAVSRDLGCSSGACDHQGGAIFGHPGQPTPISSLINPAAPMLCQGTDCHQKIDGQDCHPKCHWSCGDATCDEVCEPVCAPPQCETACSPLQAGACRQVCAPPHCATVCPTASCAHGGCPGCKTVCAPPKCRTECAENCESKCAEPQCVWKCNPGKCEKPRCSLTCGGAKACGLNGDLNKRPTALDPGYMVISKGLGTDSLKSVQDSAAAPAAPAPAAQSPAGLR